MTENDRRRWEQRYTSGQAPIDPAPNRWLVAQVAHLAALEAAAAPPPTALDLACGAGGALLWLARRGWQVTGVDISPTALARAQAQLAAAGLHERATLLAADLDDWRPPAESYDLITSFFFLDRRLWPSLRAAVRPGGFLCFCTYHTGRLAERPQTNPAHLLQPGELAALAQSWGWRVLAAQTDRRRDALLAQKEL